MSSMGIKNLEDLKSAQCFVCVTSMILYLTELSLVTKSESFMIIVKDLVNGLIVMSLPNTFQNQSCISKKKIMIV